MTSPSARIEGRNRLGEETSPYLLQHRSNPVHWWAWGEDAFAAARAADKPIFLSIGYSTCYWCHVMERESFENEAIAALMNEHFICIKVDREERPDVDDVYMSAVQAIAGSGGWPMSVWLEPYALKPFLAGTYFPPEDRYGRPGFPSVLRQVAEAWAGQREQVLAQAEHVAAFVTRQHALAPDPQPVGIAQVDLAVSQLLSTYDSTDGGFGPAPKFPMPAYLDLLMSAGWELQSARDAVTHTLDRMATGGMYDQVGGGFHRYSTDAKWLVPHFEKMLYDNGQLASTYARAYELTGDAFYGQIVRRTLDWTLREMTDERGAFFSAQDAEVNHREGGNYLWIEAEIREALAAAGLADDVDFALEVYGFNGGTNFRDPHHPGDPPRNVVHLVARPDMLAGQMGETTEAFDERLARINAALLAVRDKRDQPLTDDKILAGWNGLMLAGMADGGRVLGEARYIEAAQRAAAYVLKDMRAADGGLLRTARHDEAKIDAFLEDYAFMIRGLLALQRASDDLRWLEAAAALADLARQRFWDDVGGGYFDTLPDQSDLFVRVKSTYDGATPSGNSAMLMNLVELGDRTGEARYVDGARATLKAMSHVIAARPTASAAALPAVERLAHREKGVGSPFRTGPVQITVSRDALALAGDGEVMFDLTLTPGSGFHINAHEPGLAHLIPLEVMIIGGEGIELRADYPEGELYEGPEGGMRVHHDAVTIPVRLRRVGAITGRAQIMVTFQACTDRACLGPQTAPLPVRIESQ